MKKVLRRDFNPTSDIHQITRPRFVVGTTETSSGKGGVGHRSSGTVREVEVTGPLYLWLSVERLTSTDVTWSSTENYVNRTLIHETSPHYKSFSGKRTSSTTPHSLHKHIKITRREHETNRTTSFFLFTL